MRALIFLIIFGGIFIGLAVGLFYIVGDEESLFCATDTKICDDGVILVRSGANCEFKECPGKACRDLGCEIGSRFVGSINSDKFYECDCKWAKQINKENLVCFTSEKNSLADGRIRSAC